MKELIMILAAISGTVAAALSRTPRYARISASSIVLSGLLCRVETFHANVASQSQRKSSGLDRKTGFVS
jgi:hypothetical protein